MDTLRKPRKTIDIVMPAYNEACCIGRTIETLFGELEGSRYRFEVIVVDDGSSDETAAVVKTYINRYPITLISLTRNFGKETALLAGLDCASGDATIIMDADLQHPIALIPKFLEQWEAGYECVYGVKRHRHGETLLKRLCAKAFYFGVNGGSDVRIPPDAVDFRLLDKAAVQALCAIRERVRFTKGLYAWLGFRSIGIPFVPAARTGGASRFGTSSLLRLGWDGLISFSELPLRVLGLAGAAVAAAAVLYGLYIAARTIVFGIDVPGWATLTVALTFLGGLQILFLWVLGEYVRNVFIETKQRPNYFVRERVGRAASNRSASELEHGAATRSGRVAA